MNHRQTKGYPLLYLQSTRTVERAGNGVDGGGPLLAFYTVLTEGDDQQDPIADSARAILMAISCFRVHWRNRVTTPAIDIEASISRAI